MLQRTPQDDLRYVLQEVAMARAALAKTPPSRKVDALKRLGEAERLAVKLMKRIGVG